MLKEYMPIIVGFITAVVTVYGNILIGKWKNRTDTKVIVTNAGDALRDDLIALIDRYEKREQWLVEQLRSNEKRNEDLQKTINTLYDEIISLRRENKDLKAELQKTQHDLQAFERKVYYIPEKDKEVQ